MVFQADNGCLFYLMLHYIFVGANWTFCLLINWLFQHFCSGRKSKHFNEKRKKEKKKIKSKLILN